MKNSLLGFLGALGAAAVLAAGCGGSGAYSATNVATPTPVPTPSVACTMLPGEQVSLVYPPASPVPTPSGSVYAGGIVVAAAPVPLPTNWYVYAVSPLSTSPASGQTMTAPPSPLPTPFTDPGLANETIQYSPNGTFGSAVGTWNVFVANTSCFPGVQIGSFSS